MPPAAPKTLGPSDAEAGAWPSRCGQGGGRASASGPGLAPPLPRPSGFPSRPPSVGRSCAESSVFCGCRRTLLRARPPWRAGSARPAERWPALSEFPFPPLAPSATNGSSAVSLVLEPPPAPSLAPLPRLFPLLEPTGKPKQLDPRRREGGNG